MTPAETLLRKLDNLQQEAQERWKDWPPEKVNALMINIKYMVKEFLNTL